MDSPLLTELRARFERLPFDTTRIGRHLAAGHTTIGSFLQRVDRLFQAEILARPAGRERLARGDSETYIDASGTQVAWAVTAVVEGTAILSIKVLHPTDGVSEHSAAFDVATRSPVDAGEHKDPAVAALLADATPASVWQARRHLLDLWDWNAGLAHGASGVTVHAHSELEGAWLVETPAGSFEWTPVGRRNLVAPASGAMPAEAAIRALFLGPPEMIGGK
jgi:hypothetical protein